MVKLTLAPEDPILGRQLPPPPLLEIIDGEEEFIIEEVLDSKVVNRKLRYLIKWEGYGIELGLGTSGSAGDPDPYPWVFWAPKVIPGSVKIFPTDHPEPWVKNPQVHRYPWVYL